MQIPIIRGIIDRRILVNYRVDPDVLSRIVPRPFRPQVVAGWGVAGICLIRLKGVRPRWLPRFLGLGSENAAHRIAVEWDDAGATRRGVYIPRRDSSSIWNALAGGRLFPGLHHHSRFVVRETDDEYSIHVTNADGTRIAVEGRISPKLPSGSIFESMEGASSFFSCGSIGYSTTRRPGVFDGLELCTQRWEMTPLALERAESSWFSNSAIFPGGSIAFDSALLMREIPHEWHGRGRLIAPTVCEPAAIPS